MTTKFRNSFIHAALEDLQTPSVNAPPLTEVNIDDSKDAVAELMEKNVKLADENIELQTQSFDNDVEAIDNTSDSVSKDLDEAVAVTSALENLAELCNLTVKSGNASVASVASHVFAMEQILDRIGLASPIAALEAEALQLEGPAEQTQSVGNKAKEKAAELGKKLIEGIKRIVGWLMGVLRNVMARSTKLASHAKQLLSRIEQIDESKTIDSKPFIHSLRLVKGGGDPTKQFETYAQMATKTLYGFYNQGFLNSMAEARKSLFEFDPAQQQDNTRFRKQLNDIMKTAMDNIFTENGLPRDVAAQIPESVSDNELVVGLTKPVIGGLQLYLAATVDRVEDGYYAAGLVKQSPEFDTPDTIPVVDKKVARNYLNLIQKWMGDQKVLEHNMAVLSNVGKEGYMLTTADISAYIKTLSMLVGTTAPQLLRLNIQNSASFIAYVERSIAASNGGESKE